jgi:hypothetical protein
MHINIDGKKIDTAEFAEFCELGLMQDGVTVRKEARGAYPFHFGNWVAASLVAVTESGAYVLTPRGADLRASLASFPVEPKAEPAKGKACSDCNGEGKKPLLHSFHTCDTCKGTKVEPESATTKISRWAAAMSAGRIVLPRSPDTWMLGPGSYRILENVARGYDAKQHTISGNATHVDYDKRPGSYGYRIAGLSERTRNGLLNTDPLLPHSDVQIVGGTAVDALGCGDNRPWTLIDSEETACVFVGQLVEIDAPASKPPNTEPFDAHPGHGETLCIVSVDADELRVANGFRIRWRGRGNVRLRLAPPQVPR